MKSNKNIFTKKERGLAIETAQERQRSFGENLDGTSHVPIDPLKRTVTDIKKKKIKSPKRKF